MNPTIFSLCLRRYWLVIAGLLLWNITFAQDDLSKITVRTIPAGGSVYMLDCENGFGGGNVAASVGPDGILLVDDMFAAVTSKVVDAAKKLSPQGSVRIVVNSHFHGDHIQGNKVMSSSAILVAHENVWKRLTTQGSSKEAWPHITFTDKLTLHFNGEDIRVFHLPDGHTDADAYIYFTKSNVIHMGDTFFNGMFPAVYTEGGGNIRHLITNLEQVLTEIPEDVKVIPGHGNLATKADLKYAVTMLKETMAAVDAGIRAGKSLEQLQKENILAKYNALGDGGAQTTEQYLAMLYKLLKDH